MLDKDYRAEAQSLRIELYQAKEHIRLLESRLAGEDLDPNRLFSKIMRQRDALDILNRRVVTQRFQLRSLNEMGRGLTKEEWLELKDKALESDPSRNARVSDELLVV